MKELKTHYDVRRVDREDYTRLIETLHYSKTVPSVSHAFGLFYNPTNWIFNCELSGVVTFGTPFSPTLKTGIAGSEFKHRVFELNRLVLTQNRPNEASRLITRAIKQLPKNRIIVTYADPSYSHVGYIYQACNFHYTGMSKATTDWRVRGKDHLHQTTIGDEFRGKSDRIMLLKKKYGDDFYIAERQQKHRYLFVHGDKRFKRDVMTKLRYEIEPYPKS